MKVLKWLLLSVVAVSLLTACSFWKKTVQSEIEIVSYEKEQLVRDAAVILTGEVAASEGQDDHMGFPATDYLVKVDQVYKGSPGAEVEVRTMGGENKKMKYIPGKGAVTFQVGEEVLLFLTDQKGDRPDQNDFGYYVVGQFQGKFVEDNGEWVNEKLTFHIANFEKELHELAP